MATIFFVDDDPASELVVENLRHRGHDVHRSASVDDALRNIDLIAKGDLVVLDLIMPGSPEVSGNSDGTHSTGMLVFREIRRRRADVPILVFTANQDLAHVSVIEADQHARYISRWSSPKFQEFVEIVHKMLGIRSRPVPTLRAFIVHGHDDRTKLEVKNYIQNTLGLPEPIILHEQPSLGRTLIEKFEDLSTTAELAFVLLTPDDHIAGPSEGDAEKRRARQNVILELGFFLGTLGRLSGRVFLLYKGPLDLPSDLSGLIYVDISKGIEAVSDQIRREIAAIRAELLVEGDGA